MSFETDKINIPPICDDREIHLFIQHNPLVGERVVLFRDPYEHDDEYKFKDNIFYISKSGKRGEFNPQVTMYTYDIHGKKHRYTSHINLLRYPTLAEFKYGRKMVDANREDNSDSPQATVQSKREKLKSTYTGLSKRQFELLLLQVTTHKIADLIVNAPHGLKPEFGTSNARLQFRVQLGKVYEDWEWLYGAFLNKTRPVFRNFIDPTNTLTTKELIGLFFGIMTSVSFNSLKKWVCVLGYEDGTWVSVVDALEVRPKVYPLIQYINEYRNSVAKFADLKLDFEDAEIEVEDVET